MKPIDPDEYLEIRDGAGNLLGLVHADGRVEQAPRPDLSPEELRREEEDGWLARQRELASASLELPDMSPPAVRGRVAYLMGDVPRRFRPRLPVIPTWMPWWYWPVLALVSSVTALLLAGTAGALGLLP